MNMLSYNLNKCYIRRGESTFTSGIKPDLSFEYEVLFYDGVIAQRRFEDADHPLTAEQKSEVEGYIASIEADTEAQEKLEAFTYLTQTDWYVIRHTETAKEIPADVLIKRGEARDVL